MMQRRVFLAGSVVLVAAPLVGRAQQPGKVYRIGFMTAGADAPGPLLAAFRQGLSELGYIDGQNLIIEWRFAEGR